VINLAAGNNLLQNANVSSSGGNITASASIGAITMVVGSSSSSGGGAIGYSAPAGNVVLSKLDAGSTGSINLSAGGDVSAVVNPSLFGGTATLNIGGNAAFNTQVQTLNGTVNGTLTVADTGGTAFTGTVGSANAPIVAAQQAINTALPATSDAAKPSESLATDSTSSSTSNASIAANAVTAATSTTGSAGTPSQSILTSPGSTIGGTLGSFAESEPVVILSGNGSSGSVSNSSLDTGSNASGSSTPATASDETTSKDDKAKKDEDSKKNNGKNNSKDKPNAKPEKC
jgi:hypothetical protein